MKTYTIKPLEWNGREDSDGVFKTAQTPFGLYTVECDPGETGCRWSFCFDEYYDEDDFACDSVADGIEAARQHWHERLSGALDEQEGGAK